MSYNTNELRQKREALTGQMREFVQKETEFRAAGDTVKADEMASSFTDIEKKHADLTGQIARMEQMKTAESEEAERFITERQLRTGNTPHDEVVAQHKESFMQFFRGGVGGLNTEQRNMVMNFNAESRAQTTTNSAGGYTIPAGFLPELDRAMKDYSGVLQAARVITTETGNSLPWPTMDGTARKAAIVAEGVQSTPADFTFGQKSLLAYTYRDLATASLELLQDSYFDLAGFFTDSFSESLGRGVNTDFTNGDDSGKPNGVVTASTLGKTAASATAFTRPEIVDLLHSVDPGYRKSPKCGFMMNDLVVAAIKKLALGSGDASPLWQASMRDGTPDKIEGFQFWVNQDMESALTTGKKLILFGDFNKYIVRRVAGMTIQRLQERFIDYGLIGFILFARYDAELSNTAAIKHLKLA